MLVPSLTLLLPFPTPLHARGLQCALCRLPRFSQLHKRAVPGPAPRPGAGGGRKPALLWFRNDVRLHDNEALAAANRHGSSLLPVYVFDPREFGDGEETYKRETIKPA